MPRLTPITASVGLWPAAQALIPSSLSMTIDGRNWHSRGDHYFLHNIQKSLFQWTFHILRLNQPAAQRFGNDRTTRCQGYSLAQVGRADDSARAKIVVPPIRRFRTATPNNQISRLE